MNKSAAAKAEWQERTLDETADNLDSRRVPIIRTDQAIGPYPYYGASGIVDYVSDYIFDGEAFLISEDGANLLARSAISLPAPKNTSISPGRDPVDANMRNIFTCLFNRFPKFPPVCHMTAC